MDSTALHFDSGRISALYEPGGDALIVCFAPRQRDSAPWGRDFLRRLGVSVLCITDYTASWYPAEDMERILLAFEARLRAHARVMTYGFSMGGYAALKFSRLFRAELNLAFSPQYSIEPELVGHFDKRRPGHFFDAGVHRSMAIKAEDVSGDALLLYDPFFREDRLHAQLISRDIPAKAILTPFARHDSLAFSHETGTTEALMRDFVQGRVSPSRLRRMFRDGRRRSARYLIAASSAMAARGRLAASLRILEAAHPGARANTAFILEKARRLFEAGMIRDAAGLLDELEPANAAEEAEDLALCTWRRLNAHLDLDGDKREFPHHDTAWSEVAHFLTLHARSGHCVLAPALFRRVLPGVTVDAPSPFTPVNAHDWVVVHKGDLRGFSDSFLRSLQQLMYPVCANSVFVVWSSDPGLMDSQPFADIHLNSFYAMLRKRRLLLRPINRRPNASRPLRELIEFLERHVKYDDTVTASVALHSLFNNKTVHLPQEASASEPYAWIVLHKGIIDEYRREDLIPIVRTSTPVYANEVFVVLAGTMKAGLQDQGDNLHARILYKRLGIGNLAGAKDLAAVPAG